MQYYAHTDPSGRPPSDGGWQLLEDHLNQVAMRARGFADRFGAGNWAELLGLWHDAGKYSQEFQKYLLSTLDESVDNPGRVDHSTYGAQRAVERFPGGPGKLLAYSIAGHHGGLPNGTSIEGSSLADRLKKALPYTFQCPGGLFEKSPPVLPFEIERKRGAFQLAFFTRMLFSCLVDADFLDTERHMSPEKALTREGRVELGPLKDLLDKHLSELVQQVTMSEVNNVRRTVLEDCIRAAKLNPGLFSLTVPTGGGKTLSSMAFALNHALQHGMERVIYVIPYTSIIEQNADVFRSVFGEDSVLEHHSNFEISPDRENSRTRLASENWDMPIVVTTNVQFYESLFSNRTSKCRKIHRIAKSVVVLDEVQSFPAHLLYPSLEALRELASTYHTSIVLCSATQPAIQVRDDFPRGLSGVREIITDPDLLQKKMKRVNLRPAGTLSDVSLADELRKRQKVLCIVNTKKQAHALYRLLAADGGAFHLSTLMYPLHRRRKFASIRSQLKIGQPCRVVSTQLIEAGVDIDFPVVYRAICGIDSIAQAAGRCNREGKLERGEVVVFEPEGGVPAGVLRQMVQVGQGVLRRFGENVLSLDGIDAYFREYYWSRGDDELDREGIIRALDNGKITADFPFQEIADSFRLIETVAMPIVIPIENDAKREIDSLKVLSSFRGVARRLQKYTVQVHPHYWKKLRDRGAINLEHEMFPILDNLSLYDDEVGLNIYLEEKLDAACFVV